MVSWQGSPLLFDDDSDERDVRLENLLECSFFSYGHRFDVKSKHTSLGVR